MLPRSDLGGATTGLCDPCQGLLGGSGSVDAPGTSCCLSPLGHLPVTVWWFSVPVSREYDTAELQLPQRVALASPGLSSLPCGSRAAPSSCAGSVPCPAGAEANPLLLQLPS